MLETDITNAWGEGHVPVVSILCSTYNHERFIADAIEGFLQQKTTFPFEIIIHDDASTDATAEIVKDYAARFPNVIRAVLQERNQYQQGKKILFGILPPLAKGEFLAFCEGDDYWMDPMKLEKQVEVLQAHRYAMIVGHRARKVDAEGRSLSIFPGHQRFKVRPGKVIAGSGGFCATNSLVMRKTLFTNVPEWFAKFPVGDAAVMNLAVNRGEILFLNDVMSVYRSNVPQSWSAGLADNPARAVAHYRRTLEAYNGVIAAERHYRWAYRRRRATVQLLLLEARLRPLHGPRVIQLLRRLKHFRER